MLNNQQKYKIICKSFVQKVKDDPRLKKTWNKFKRIKIGLAKLPKIDIAKYFKAVS